MKKNILICCLLIIPCFGQTERMLFYSLFENQYIIKLNYGFDKLDGLEWKLSDSILYNISIVQNKRLDLKTISRQGANIVYKNQTVDSVNHYCRISAFEVNWNNGLAVFCDEDSSQWVSTSLYLGSIKNLQARKLVAGGFFGPPPMQIIDSNLYYIGAWDKLYTYNTKSGKLHRDTSRMFWNAGQEVLKHGWVFVNSDSQSKFINFVTKESVAFNGLIEVSNNCSSEDNIFFYSPIKGKAGLAEKRIDFYLFDFRTKKIEKQFSINNSDDDTLYIGNCMRVKEKLYVTVNKLMFASWYPYKIYLFDLEKKELRIQIPDNKPVYIRLW